MHQVRIRRRRTHDLCPQQLPRLNHVFSDSFPSIVISLALNDFNSEVATYFGIASAHLPAISMA